MIPTSFQTLANVAEGLRDDEIHVWHVDYAPRAGRAPLRGVLAAYLGLQPAQVMLTDSEHGRPSLAAIHDQTLGFNWSHSGSHALIAVARHIQPGIDVERRRDRRSALEIAERYFTTQESAILAALPGEQRGAAFLELWTAKEAVLKAVGRGIAFGLNRLDIVSRPDTLDLRQLDGDDVSAWQLQRLAPADDLIAALAWRGGPRRISQHALGIDPLAIER